MLKVKDILKATNGKLINGEDEITITSYKIDSREVNSGDFFIPLPGERTDGHKYLDMVIDNGCIGFFVSKEKIDNLDIKCFLKRNRNLIIIEVEDTLKALHMIGEYNRNIHIDIPIIAVTGSVGKTSTREIISSVLYQEKKVITTEKNMNSNIGLSLMTLKLKDQDVGIFEAGISKMDEMSRLQPIINPTIGILTNIREAHQENFASLQIKCMEKIALFSNCDVIIYDGDNALISNCLELNCLSIKTLAWSKKDQERPLYISKIIKKRCSTKIQFVYSNLNESPIIMLVLLVKDGKFGTKIGPPVSIKNAQTYQNIFKE